MARTDIPLDKAELLGLLLEGVLYGFSLLMFVGTVQLILSRRPLLSVDRKVLVIACFLLFNSTMHFIMHTIRVMFGLILYRDTYPGGPVAYFSDVTQWTFNAKNHAFIMQTMVGDSVVIYRCYMIWQSYLVVVVPMLLWCATSVCGIVSCVVALHTTEGTVFGGATKEWVTAFWASALLTNLSAMLLLTSRIWYLDRYFTKLSGGDVKSYLQPILKIVLESGAMYTLALVVGLVLYVAETNGQLVVLDMMTPIIAITFYMVIVRVQLASRDTETQVPIISSITFMNGEDGCKSMP